MQFPKVYIPYVVSEIIVGLRKHHAKLEWSIIGKVDLVDGKLIVSDIFIPKQKNSPAYTEMEDPLGEIQNYLLESDKYLEAHKWRLRLHSHNTMQPFWSGTDNATRKSLCTDVFFEKDKGYGWALSIVIGNGEKYHATVDYCYGEGDEAVRCKQDVEVVTGLVGDDYEVSQELIDEYLNSLSFNTPNTAIESLVPTELAQLLLADSLATIETKKEQHKQFFIEYMIREESKKNELDLINRGVLQPEYNLEQFTAELVEKEKQPLPVYPTYPNKNNYNQIQHGHNIQKMSKKQRKKNRSESGYLEQYGVGSTKAWKPHMVTDKDFIEEGYIYDEKFFKYRFIETGELFDTGVVRDRICESWNGTLINETNEEYDDAMEDYYRSQSIMQLEDVQHDDISHFGFVYNSHKLRRKHPHKDTRHSFQEAQQEVYNAYVSGEFDVEVGGEEVKSEWVMPTFYMNDYGFTTLEELDVENVQYNNLIHFGFKRDETRQRYTHPYTPTSLFTELQAKQALVMSYKNAL